MEMGHKSAVAAVLSNQIPVLPTCTKTSCIKQPPYFRSKNTIATSSRLIGYRSCVASEMAGKSGTQASIRSAFAAAAKKCSGRA
jgi:hypothetical protein